MLLYAWSEKNGMPRPRRSLHSKRTLTPSAFTSIIYFAHLASAKKKVGEYNPTLAKKRGKEGWLGPLNPFKQGEHPKKGISFVPKMGTPDCPFIFA